MNPDARTLTVCSRCDSLNRVAFEKIRNQKAVCGKCQEPLPMLGAVTPVNEKNFWRILEKADRPVIVDFWAAWCGPCKMYGPIFQEASMKTDAAIFLKVDTEASPGISARFGIRSIPSTLVFDQGREVRRESGALPLPAVLALAGTR